MRQDIEFKSRGETCRGWFYIPEGEGPFPAVVTAGGMPYVKDIVMPHYADVFVSEGLAVLIFDYRHLGTSDGTPRVHVHPFEQFEDIMCGISFVETRPEVDRERIGLWGISYAGGHALAVGALDRRVKCIVSIVPIVDGYDMVRRGKGDERFEKLVEVIMEDRRKRFVEGVGGRIDMCSADIKDSAVFLSPEATEYFTKVKEAYPLYSYYLTIETFENLLAYSVFPYVGRILNTPTLMILSENDPVCTYDRAIEAFHQIPSTRKKLVIFPETHMGLYKEGEEKTIRASVEWLKQYLIEPSEAR